MATESPAANSAARRAVRRFFHSRQDLAGLIFVLLMMTIFAQAWFASTPLPLGGPNVVLAGMAVFLLLFHLASRAASSWKRSTGVPAVVEDFRNDLLPVIPAIAVSALLAAWMLAVYLRTDTLDPTRLGRMALGVGVLFAAYLSVDSIYRVKLMLLATIVATVVSALFGFAVLLVGDPFLTMWLHLADVSMDKLSDVFTKGRMAGLALNTQIFAGQVAVGILLSFAALLYDSFGNGSAPGKTCRAALFVALMTMMTALVVNATRSALLGVLVSAGAIALSSLRAPRRRRRLLFIVPLMAIWLLAFFNPVFAVRDVVSLLDSDRPAAVDGLLAGSHRLADRSDRAVKAHAIAGITAGLVYTVQLRARNDRGFGDAVEIAAKAENDGRLTLIWDDPNDPDITGYQFRLRAAGETEWRPWRDFITFLHIGSQVVDGPGADHGVLNLPTESRSVPLTRFVAGGARVDADGEWQLNTRDAITWEIDASATSGTRRLLVAEADESERTDLAVVRPGSTVRVEADAANWGEYRVSNVFATDVRVVFRLSELTASAGNRASLIEGSSAVLSYEHTRTVYNSTLEGLAAGPGRLAGRGDRPIIGHTIGGVNSQKRYEVQLRARFGQEYGVENWIAAVAGREGALILTWIDPDDPGVTGYQFRLRRGDAQWTPWLDFVPTLSSKGPIIEVFADSDGPANSNGRPIIRHIITCRIPGRQDSRQECTAQLRAQNEYGYGPASAEISANAVRDGGLTLAWREPGDLTGIVAGYQFRLLSPAYGMWLPWRDFTPSVGGYRQSTPDAIYDARAMQERLTATRVAHALSAAGLNVNPRIGEILNRSAEMRIHMAITAFRYALDHPLGTGVYAPTMSHVSAELEPRKKASILSMVPHNQFLNVLVFFGYPGFILSILFYGLVLRSVTRTMRVLLHAPTTILSGLTVAVAGAIGAYSVISLLFSSGPFVADWSHFLLVGLVFSIQRIVTVNNPPVSHTRSY